MPRTINPKIIAFFESNHFSFINIAIKKIPRGIIFVYFTPILKPQNIADIFTLLFKKYFMPIKMKKALKRSFLTIDIRNTLIGIEIMVNNNMFLFFILKFSIAKSIIENIKIMLIKKWKKRGTISPAKTDGINEIS
jgi:hypothetical protein